MGPRSPCVQNYHLCAKRTNFLAGGSSLRGCNIWLHWSRLRGWDTFCEAFGCCGCVWSIGATWHRQDGLSLSRKLESISIKLSGVRWEIGPKNSRWQVRESSTRNRPDQPPNLSSKKLRPLWVIRMRKHMRATAASDDQKVVSVEARTQRVRCLFRVVEQVLR